VFCSDINLLHRRVVALPYRMLAACGVVRRLSRCVQAATGPEQQLNYEPHLITSAECEARSELLANANGPECSVWKSDAPPASEADTEIFILPAQRIILAANSDCSAKRHQSVGLYNAAALLTQTAGCRCSF
jgi:hypothetical protein